MLPFEGENAADKMLRFVEEKGNAGFWVWDITARKSEWSNGFYALLGLEPGSVEPTYQAIDALVHPDDRRPPGQLAHIFAQALPADRSFRIIRPDGRTRWLRSTGEVLVGADGNPYKAVGLVVDETDHHEQRHLLQVGHDRFDTLVKLLHAVIWIARPWGEILSSFNWSDLTGNDGRLFLGEGWLDFIHPDDRERTRESWQASIANKTPYEIEHRARASDGTYHWYKSRARPVLNDDGAVREWVGISIDVTEGKTLSSSRKTDAPLTGAQIRAARGILNWSVRDLAEKAQVSGSTIRRLEESDGPASSGEAAIAPIRRALEEAGVEFLFPEGSKPGLRPR